MEPVDVLYQILDDLTVITADDADELIEELKRRGFQIVPVAVTATEREYDPDVAPCDDAEFGMKP